MLVRPAGDAGRGCLEGCRNDEESEFVCQEELSEERTRTHATRPSVSFHRSLLNLRASLRKPRPRHLFHQPLGLRLLPTVHAGPDRRVVGLAIWPQAIRFETSFFHFVEERDCLVPVAALLAKPESNVLRLGVLL